MVVINISLKSCHFFLLGCGTGAGGLSQEGVGVRAPAWPGSGVSVNASLDVTKLSVTLMSLPGILQKIFLTEVRSRMKNIQFNDDVLFFVSL